MSGLSGAKRAAGRGSKAQRAEGAKGRKGAELALPLAADGAGHNNGWWLKEGSPQSMVVASGVQAGFPADVIFLPSE